MSCSFNHATFAQVFLASRGDQYSPMTAMPIARSASLVAFSEMIKIWHVFFGRFQHRTEVLKYTGFRLYGLRIYSFISLIWSMVNQILVLNFSDIWTFQLQGVQQLVSQLWLPISQSKVAQLDNPFNHLSSEEREFFWCMISQVTGYITLF